MTTSTAAHPKIVPRDEWLAARNELLTKEKELTRLGDALNAERRRLPMVEIEKDYAFEGPGGKTDLRGLFDGRRQLIVYHFMFDPDDPPPGKSEPWAEGCSGCSHVADNIPHLAHLHARGTSLVFVSRARLSKIAPFQRRMGWPIPWYSSFGSDFNYDFHTTTDEAVARVEYNYKDKATLEREGLTYHIHGEQHALSVFLRLDDKPADRVFHAYSTYGRGVETFLATYRLLDLTPYARQEDWENSPPGWPQTPTHPGWLRHHDKYAGGPKDSAPCCRSTPADA